MIAYTKFQTKDRLNDEDVIQRREIEIIQHMFVKSVYSWILQDQKELGNTCSLLIL